MEFECDANGAVVETLGTDEYESLALVGVRSTVQLVRGNDGVTVVVERPADEPYPDWPTASPGRSPSARATAVPSRSSS